MTKVNRGKDFEEQIRIAFENIPDVSIDRIPDQMGGFAGGSNVCDFIVYDCPSIYYLECKSFYGNTMSIFSNPKTNKLGVKHGFYGNITDTQWKGLLEKSKIKGAVAGYMIWAIEWDKTFFISAEDMKAWRDAGHKSINMNEYMDIPHYAIKGQKRRVLFDYDMIPFLKGENYEQDKH